MTDEMNDRLQQAIDAIRSGDTDTARNLLQDITDEDPENAKAWLLMARVVDDVDEKRIVLSNVLQLEPDNEQAQKLLQRLEESKAAPTGSDEVFPGIPRRLLTLVVAGCLAFAVIMCGIVFVIASGVNTQRTQQTRDVRASEQALLNSQATLDALETIKAETETQVAVAPSQTAFALITPTRSGPTLVPSDTPTSPPTETPTREPLPPFPGTLIAWGGRNIVNSEFYELFSYSLSAGGNPEGRLVNDDAVQFPTVHVSGQRITYAVHQSGASLLVTYDTASNQIEQLGTIWSGKLQLNNPTMSSYSSDGTKLVFIGTDFNNQTREVYLADINARTAVRLTNDTANYSLPSLSPDGTRVAVIRESPEAGTDIVTITTSEPFTATNVTSDGNANLETSPIWLQDGTQIIYSVAASTAPNNHDIKLIFSDGRNALAPPSLVATEADEIYPVKSPDGRYIAYASNNGGSTYDIFIFELATRNTWRLTDNPTQDIFPAGWSGS